MCILEGERSIYYIITNIANGKMCRIIMGLLRICIIINILVMRVLYTRSVWSGKISKGGLEGGLVVGGRTLESYSWIIY